MYGIAVLNKHLTPTLEEELHRCKYLWIIMVLPVNGLIEDFLMGKKNNKKKKNDSLEAQTSPLRLLLYLAIIHS